MPSARITKTFWVASKRATPPQMAAIQNHRGDPEWMLASSITGSYSTVSRMRPTMQRIDGCLQGNRVSASGSGLPESGTQEPGREAEARAECQKRYCGADPWLQRWITAEPRMMSDVYLHRTQHWQ